MECSVALVVYFSVKFIYSEKATKFDELVMTLISNFRWIFRQIFCGLLRKPQISFSSLLFHYLQYFTVQNFRSKQKINEIRLTSFYSFVLFLHKFDMHFEMMQLQSLFLVQLLGNISRYLKVGNQKFTKYFFQFIFTLFSRREQD